MINKTWKKLSLGEVVTLQRGYDLPQKERKHGTIPIISSSGRIDTHNESRVVGPGVVTGRYGTIGEVFFISKDFWPLNTTLFVKDFKGNDPLFISFLLRTIDYQSYSGKSGVPGVNRNDLHEISVNLPPLSEQQAIATALSDVDALITSLDKLITKKRDIKQATMQQLLTGKTRLPGFSEEQKPGYKQTEVGEIPEDWELVKIGDYAFVTKLAGFEYTSHFDYQKSGPIIAIRALNIKNGKLDLTDVHTLPYETSKQLSRSQLAKGDLVISYVGTLGRVAVINDDDKFHLAPNVAKIRTKLDQVDPFYLSQSLNGEIGQQAIFKVAASTTQAALSMHNLREVTFILPPLPEQQAIATVLSDMDAEITALEQKRDKIRALKQGMMQELLTGKTRLL